MTRFHLVPLDAYGIAARSPKVLYAVSRHVALVEAQHWLRHLGNDVKTVEVR